MKSTNAEELDLSPRVYEATYWAAEGLQNKFIARKMNITQNSVAELLQKAYQKLDVAGRVGLITMLNRREIKLTAPVPSAADSTAA